MAPFGTQTTSMANLTTLHGCGVCLTVDTGRSNITSDETTCSTCWIDSGLKIQAKCQTGCTIILGTPVSGNNNITADNFFRYCIDCSTESAVGVQNGVVNNIDLNPAMIKTLSACGQNLTVQKKVSGGTMTMYGTAERRSFIEQMAVGGGCFTVSTQSDILSGDDSTSSASLVATSLALTLANRACGKYLAVASLCNHGSGFINVSFRMEDGGVLVTNGLINTSNGATSALGESTGWSGNLDGGTIEVHFAAATGSAILHGSCCSFARMEVFEVSGGCQSVQEDHNPSGNEADTCSCYTTTSLGVTLPNRADGRFMILNFSDSFSTGSVNIQNKSFNIGGAIEDGVAMQGRGGSWVATMMTAKSGVTGGQSADFTVRLCAGSTTSFRGGGCCTSRDRGYIITFEVSP